MATHWLDALSRRLASPTSRRRFLGRAAGVTLTAMGGSLLLHRGAPPASAAAASPTVCCRYLCDGAAVGRAAPGHHSVLVWVTAADPCPQRLGCEWLQRIEMAQD
jgi:hypothetical protein